MIKWLTIFLAACGVAVGVYAVATNKTPLPEVPLARPASVNPFARGVAALGIVEPADREVLIIAPEAGIIAAVHAQVGDRVSKGDPLFELDTRVIDSELVRAQAQVLSAESEVTRWRALPRVEDLPPLKATVARAEAVLADRREQLRVTEEASRRGGAVSRDVDIARFGVEAAQADVDRVKGELASISAGGWAPDLVVLQGRLASAKAQVKALQLLHERLFIRAPRDATVLRRSIEAGAFASTDPSRPAMILGDVSRLHIRAQVDEEDIALLGDGSTIAGAARTRGSMSRDIPLRLVRIEPFARPKADITGSNSERVDTRVIDVVFEAMLPKQGDINASGGSITPVNASDRLHLYPGQAVDVFIDTGTKAPTSTAIGG